MAIEKEGGHRHDIAALDSRGLLVDDVEFSDGYKNELAWPLELAKERGVDGPGGRDLLSVVKAFRPTVLIGTSGRPGAFNRAVIESAREHCEAPIVLPFSNPTDYAEARPGEVLRWTNGSAIVATGSPFADVNLDGRTFRIGQGANRIEVRVILEAILADIGNVHDRLAGYEVQGLQDILLPFIQIE